MAKHKKKSKRKAKKLCKTSVSIQKGKVTVRATGCPLPKR